MALIPDSKYAGYWQTINGVTSFVPRQDVPCAYAPSQQNVNLMPYFANKVDKCGNNPAKITKEFLNGLLSQIYCVIDKSGIELQPDWMCNDPCALQRAIQKLIDGELGGVAP